MKVLFSYLHGLLEFWSAVCTFYYGKGSSAFLYEQQIFLNIRGERKKGILPEI